MDIVLATDFSALAAHAARVAADYARRFRARLHLLHVAYPEADGALTDRLIRLAHEVAPDLESVTAVRVGAAAREIVGYAAAHDAALIVMGTHGRTGVSRALTGSVAELVVRTAGCPVLTVPRRRATVEAAPADLPVVPRCVVCVNASDDLICASCRARIRGEALSRRHDAEKPGGVF